MGFDIESEGSGSRLTVYIDYDDPPGPSRLAGKLLGGLYTRWCARNIAEGAVAQFSMG